jgi:ABC-type sugar transport system ATPase subunit
MSVSANETLAALPSLGLGPLRLVGREQKHAEAMAARLQLRARSLDQPVAELSGGNQQKIVLAKWLLTGPRVLLLDEPTRGVDVGAKEEIYALLAKWRSEGYAMLLTTSELPELLRLSDRIIVMHRGRVTAMFGRAEATREAIMHAAMGAA